MITGNILQAMMGKMALLADSIDVEGLLSSDGAASGSLSGVVDAVESYGQGGFSIMQKAAVYVAAISVVAFGVFMLVHSGNSQKMAEAKDSLVPKVAGFLCIFGPVALIVFFQTIGNGLFS